MKKPNKNMNDETIRKEEQIYQEAMATYRHFHGFVVSAFLVIGTIFGAGIAFRWVVEFPDYRMHIALAAVMFFLILFVFIIAVFIYAEYSRMRALVIACEIEKSWFPDEEDKEKRLAYNLMEIENKNPAWRIIKGIRWGNDSIWDCEKT